jgi:hypothetical protein
LRDFEQSAEDSGRLVLNEQKSSMCVGLCDFLKDTECCSSGVEETRCVGGKWSSWKVGDGSAEFIDFRICGGRRRRRGARGRWWGDLRDRSTVLLDRWGLGFIGRRGAIRAWYGDDWRHRMSRVTVAKIEEIEILTIVFLVDGNVNILMSEELQ